MNRNPPILKDLYGQLIEAACDMVRAHEETESMLDAVEAIEDDHPAVSRQYLICLWMGVNAKHRKGERP